VLKRDDMLKIIRDLARSQGSYGRLLHNITELEKDNPQEYEQTMSLWEAQMVAHNVTTPIEFILWWES
jgi:hypothetical protein